MEAAGEEQEVHSATESPGERLPRAEAAAQQPRVGDAGEAKLCGQVAGDQTGFASLFMKAVPNWQSRPTHCVIYANDVHASEGEGLLTGVTSLQLAGYFEVEEVRALAERLPAALKSLHLGNSKIEHEGMRVLVERLPAGLTSLHLGSIEIWTEGVCTLLEQLPAGLTSLHLGIIKNWTEGVRALAERLPAGLTSLHLGDNAITHEGMRALAERLPACLRSLHLGRNRIGHKGVPMPMEQLQASLTSPHMGSIQIWTEGLPAGLTSLHLGRNEFNDEGVRALAEGLPAGLTTLHLGANVITGEGVRALAERLPAGLRSLHLGRNAIGSAGVPVLAERLPAGLTRLDLGCCSLPASVLATFERHYRLLHVVAMGSDPSVQDRIQVLLKRNRKLQAVWGSEAPLVRRTSGKVLFCGDAEVGKSRLRLSLEASSSSHRLLGYNLHTLPFAAFLGLAPKERLPRTRGIEVTSISEEGRSLALWDVAGQPEYRILHSFFLPQEGPQTTVLVLVSLRKPKNWLEEQGRSLKEWLRIIASRSTEESPKRVMVAINCWREVDTGVHSEALEWCKELLAQQTVLHGAVLRVIAEPMIVDASKPGSQKLLLLKKRLFEKLGNALKDLEPVSEDCNRIASAVKGTISGAKILPWPKFLELARSGSRTAEGAAPDDEIVKAVAQYLHLIGEVVYVPISESRDNMALVAVDPGWFCSRVVGQVLLPDALLKKGEQRLAMRNGEVTLLDLKRYLKQFEEELREVGYELVVEMLIRLDLCAWASQERRSIIVPALLSATLETDSRWDEKAMIFGRRVQCLRLGGVDSQSATANTAGPESGGVGGQSTSLGEGGAEIFPPALFLRLQARLKQSWGQGSRADIDLRLAKNAISCQLQGVGILVDFTESTYMLHILARSSGDGVAEMRNTMLQLEKVGDEVRALAAQALQGNVLEELVIEPRRCDSWDGPSGWQLGKTLPVAALQARALEDLECAPDWGCRLKVMDLLTPRELEGVGLKLERSIAEKLEFSSKIMGPLFEEPRGLQATRGCESQGEADTSQASCSTSAEGSARGGMQILQAVSSLKRMLSEQQEKLLRRVDEHHADVLGRLDAHHAEVMSAFRGLKDSNKQLSRQVLTVIRSIKTFPRFMVVLDERCRLAKFRDALSPTRHMTVRLLCESEGTAVSLHPVDGVQGVKVSELKDWAVKIAPWLNMSLRVLSVALRVSGAAGIGWGLVGAGIAEVGGASLDTSLSVLQVFGSAAQVGDTISEAVSPSSDPLENRLTVGQVRGMCSDVVEQMKWGEGTFREQFGLHKVDLDREWGAHKAGDRVWVCLQCKAKMPESLGSRLWARVSAV